MKSVRQMTRRLSGILMTVCLLAGLIPAMGRVSAAGEAADGVTEVSTWEELQTALADKPKVRLVKDIVCEGPTSENYLKIGQGKQVTVDLNGYTIDRGLRGKDAIEYGCVFYNKGSLTIQDNSLESLGKITGGNNTGNGGGVSNTSGASVTMESGNICGNKSGGQGGGIYSGRGAGNVTMTGGNIRENIAKTNGGGIFAETSITCSGGKITGNMAYGHGGGVAYVQSIVDDTYAKYVFDLSDAVINGNRAGGQGGGIYYFERVSTKTTVSRMSIHGAPKVTGNTGLAGTNPSNLYLASPCYLLLKNLSDLSAEASLRVYHPRGGLQTGQSEKSLLVRNDNGDNAYTNSQLPQITREGRVYEKDSAPFEKVYYGTGIYGTGKDEPVSWYLLPATNHGEGNAYFLWAENSVGRAKFQSVPNENDNKYLPMPSEIDTGNKVINGLLFLRDLIANSLSGSLQKHLWWNSQSRVWLNKNFYEGAFTQEEQAGIIKTITASDNTVGNFQPARIYEDHVFLLSAEELISEKYGFDNNFLKLNDWENAWDQAKESKEVDTYMLRTPVDSEGTDATPGLLSAAGELIDNKIAYTVFEEYPMRPGINIDKDKVLCFTPAINPAGTQTGSKLAVVSDRKAGSKLTLKDAENQLKVTSKTVEQNKVTFGYTGAKSGTNQYVTALIIDKYGTVTYQGNLCAVDSAGKESGELTIDLTGVEMSDTDKLYVCGNQDNGDYKTNYAGALCEISLDTADYHTHKLVHREAAKAKCMAVGNIEYWFCEECEKFFQDANGATECKKSDVEIAALGHEGTESTCKNPATCTRCGQQIPPTHRWSETYESKDADLHMHYHVCLDCGEKDSGAPHELDGEYCIVCGYGLASWKSLQSAVKVNNAEITLTKDIVCDDQSLGAIEIPADHTVTIDLNGHTIDRNLKKAVENGSAMKILGKLILKDTSTANTAKQGKITGGYNSGDGGGVHLAGDGVLTIESGQIAGNRASGNGGGIYATLKNGLSKGNGKLLMSGGQICGNMADGNGGGIYVEQEYIFTLKGGTITGNVLTDASKNGAGVYCRGLENGVGEGKVYLSGMVQIKDNYAGGTGNANNLYATYWRSIQITAPLTDGSSIGISTVDAGGDIGGWNSITTYDGDWVTQAPVDFQKFHSDSCREIKFAKLTNSADLNVGAASHTWSDTYTSDHADANKHYHICTKEGCGAWGDGQAHTWDVEAEAGTVDKTCMVCGYLLPKEKKQETLTAEQFAFTAPKNPVYSGIRQNVVVEAKDGVDVGEVTVKYYKDGKAAEPVGAGTYTVKIDAAGSEEYEAAENLTDAAWTFTIAPKKLSVSVKDVEIMEGEKLPELTVNVTGFVDGENAETLSGFAKPSASADGTVDVNDTTLTSFSVVYTGGNATANYVFETNDTAKITVQKKVDAATPLISQNLSTDEVIYMEGTTEAAELKIKASVLDGGLLAYQWFSNTTNSIIGGTAVTDLSIGTVGSVEAAYTPPVNVEGTTYYYCVVTNTNSNVSGEKVVKSISNIAKITVQAKERLQSISQDNSYSAESGIALADMKLPSKVAVTTDKQITQEVQVDWHIDNPAYLENTSYDKDNLAGYSFVLEGDVICPADVEQNNVALKTKITVTVSAADKTAAPIADLPENTYPENQKAVLSTTTEGADIYYTMTTDGSEPANPSKDSTKYTERIDLIGTVGANVEIRIKAVAVKAGLQNSDVTSLTYHINIPAPHKHSWNVDEWKTDDDFHWHECTAEGCDVKENAEKDGYGSHIYDDKWDVDCNTCGFIRAAAKEMLQSIKQDNSHSAASGIALADMGFPSKVAVTTDRGKTTEAEVDWHIDNPAYLENTSYDKDNLAGYSFVLEGDVICPADVEQNNVALKTKITVTVSAADKTAAPTADLPENTYLENQKAVLSTTTEGADIYYTMTTDGSEPANPSKDSTKCTERIDLIGTVGENVEIRIKAVAVKDGLQNSDVTSLTYHINIPAPHKHSWNVDEWKTDDDFHWHECTAEGCDVKENAEKGGYGSHIYDDKWDVDCNTCGFIRAAAKEMLQSIKQDNSHSAASGIALADMGLPSKVAVTTNRGKITEAEVDWHIDNPTYLENTSYDKDNLGGYSFILEGDVTCPADVEQNNVALKTKITVTVSAADKTAAPTADLPENTYPENQKAVLSTTTEGADIYYTMTTDGSEPANPSKGSTKYTERIDLIGTVGANVEIRIKAVAVKAGLQNSDVTSLTYHINIPAPHKHSWNVDEWKTDDDFHWHECTAEGCDVKENAEKGGYGSHIYDDKWDVDCNTCGFIRAAAKEMLQSIKQDNSHSAASGIALADMGLPSKVAVTTNRGKITEAEVDWHIDNPTYLENTSYDKDNLGGYSFILEGDVTCPADVEQNNVALKTKITVTVSAADKTAAPTADLPENTYPENQKAVLSTTTEGADIYYTMTTDGSEPANPSKGSTKYTERIDLIGTVGANVEIRIKAVAVKAGLQNSDVTSLTYHINIPVPTGEAPTVTGHPEDTLVKSGETASFSVKVSGTAPFTYQWMIDRNDGKGFVAISKATGESYTTNTVDESCDGFRYQCVITNNEGSVESNIAVLKVAKESKPQENEYHITEGADQVIEESRDGTVTIKCDGAFDKFDSVYVDGAKVDKKYYTIKEGSTILTFNKEYMDSLSKGQHTIQFRYKDGGYAETTLTVKDAKNAPEESAKPVISTKPVAADGQEPAVKTGDSTPIGSLVILFGISVMILVVITIGCKKGKKFKT